MAKNRSIIRNRLADLFTAELITSQDVAQAVYGYNTIDFEGQSPVLIVYSAGSDPSHSEGVHPTRRIIQRHRFRLVVFVALPEEGDATTRSDTQDDLDTMMTAVVTTVENNQKSEGYYKGLNFEEGFSEVIPVDLVAGNLPYTVETAVVSCWEDLT